MAFFKWYIPAKISLLRRCPNVFLMVFNGLLSRHFGGGHSRKRTPSGYPSLGGGFCGHFRFRGHVGLHSSLRCDGGRRGCRCHFRCATCHHGRFTLHHFCVSSSRGLVLQKKRKKKENKISTFSY